MGASAKTLQRMLELAEFGHLPFGCKICDIGTTQVVGAAALGAARSFLDYFANKAPTDRNLPSITESQLSKITNGGFLGELLELAGFEYVALDIFQAPRTILFDLNRHAPGPNLDGQFDVVLNFGTTEHVFNQVAAFRTIHQLAKPEAVMYHDLPMAGYINHAFFRYDPLFFRNLREANAYEVVHQSISIGEAREVPRSLFEIGLTLDQVHDAGIEIVLKKPTDLPFKTALEQSTSLSIEPVPENAVDSYNVVLADAWIDYPPPHPRTSIWRAGARRTLARLLRKILGDTLVNRIRAART